HRVRLPLVRRRPFDATNVERTQRNSPATMALSNILWLVSAAVVATTASIVGRTFNTDLAAAQARVQRESVVVQTQCGPIEYAESGSGRPLLVIHGAGGGFDHATSLAEPLVARGFRVIAPSR